MDVVIYCTFLHDIYFLRVYLRFNLTKFTRFSIKDEFYKNRLNFCTFTVGGGGWKLSGGKWKVDGGVGGGEWKVSGVGWRWVYGLVLPIK